MKRIVASLIALFLIVTMTPVAIAANLDFSGKVATEAAYGKEFGGTSELELSAKIGEDMKAGLSFGSKEKEFPWENWGLQVTGLWLETNGALIPEPRVQHQNGSLNHSYWILWPKASKPPDQRGSTASGRLPSVVTIP